MPANPLLIFPKILIFHFFPAAIFIPSTMIFCLIYPPAAVTGNISGSGRSAVQEGGDAHRRLQGRGAVVDRKEQFNVVRRSFKNNLSFVLIGLHNNFCAVLHFRVKGQKAYCDGHKEILVDTNSCACWEQTFFIYRIFIA